MKKERCCEVCGGRCHRLDKLCLDCACWLKYTIRECVSDGRVPRTLSLMDVDADGFSTYRNVVNWATSHLPLRLAQTF